MFRENHQHLQSGMFDTFQQLPEKTRQRFEASWGRHLLPRGFLSG
jgi:hypothetical protein